MFVCLFVFIYFEELKAKKYLGGINIAENSWKIEEMTKVDCIVMTIVFF